MAAMQHAMAAIHAMSRATHLALIVSSVLHALLVNLVLLVKPAMVPATLDVMHAMVATHATVVMLDVSYVTSVSHAIRATGACNAMAALRAT